MLSDTNEILNSVNNEEIEVKQHFITDEKYQLLIHYQQLIRKATEVSPSIRKLINELINNENLDKLKTKLIDNFKN